MAKILSAKFASVLLPCKSFMVSWLRVYHLGVWASTRIETSSWVFIFLRIFIRRKAAVEFCVEALSHIMLAE